MGYEKDDESECLAEGMSTGGYLLHLYCCMCGESACGDFIGQTYSYCRNEAVSEGWTVPASRSALSKPWGVLCPVCTKVGLVRLKSMYDILNEARIVGNKYRFDAKHKKYFAKLEKLPTGKGTVFLRHIAKKKFIPVGELVSAA